VPYIRRERQEALAKSADMIDEGELNFVLTAACNVYVGDRKLTYGLVNAVIGALECAKLEFYRRVAVPYEDVKRSQNGDVYPAIPPYQYDPERGAPGGGG
jgi:hypothetical protein